jgi:hypothetical protein
MGYRGKLAEQERARALRSEAWTLEDIAAELGVSKSSVSLWVRDVEFEPRPRRSARRRGPNRLQRVKQAEVETMLEEGRRRIGRLSEREFLVAGAALYAGEGAKRDGAIRFANTDPRMMVFFCAWLRHFFEIDESRLRLRIYLHEGWDIIEATAYWCRVTNISPGQVRKPYRAVADPTIRTNKHVNGCAYVGYSCTRTHRAVMGLVAALLGCPLADIPG